MYKPSKRDVGVYLAALLAFIAGLLWLFMAGGCAQPYKVAWGTTAAVASARNVVDKGIGKAFEARVETCVKDRPNLKCDEKCQACVKGSQEYAAILSWRTFVRPSINASIKATVTTLVIVEKAKGGTHTHWMDLLKDAACGVLKVISEFKGLFPKEALQALKYMDMAKGFVCK